MTLFNVVKQALTIPGFDAIMLVRNGTVFVDGIVRNDPVFQINKPCVIKAGGQTVWVTPTVKKESHDVE